MTILAVVSPTRSRGLLKTDELRAALERLDRSRWTVIGFDRTERPARGGYLHFWRVKCQCGQVRSVLQGTLVRGTSLSCGCLVGERCAERNRSHGGSGLPEYEIWMAIHARCYRESHKQFMDYGGRGIRVCSRWRGPQGFQRFLDDMGRRPTSRHTIERSNNNGPYSPTNCYWATYREQMRNKRNNLRLAYRGRTMCLTAWAEEMGLAQSCLYYRIVVAKWPIEKALTTPSVGCTGQRSAVT